MTLPNWEGAYVPEAKLSGYLLSETHPIGKSKAYLLGNLGYHISEAEKLRQDLLAIANHGDLIETVATDYGMKYVVTGAIGTPSGETASLLTVWIIDHGDSRPRFVTAYPI